MKIKIRAKNFDLTPAIDEYVSKKIATLEKFLGPNKETLCEIEIGRTTNHHKSGDIFRAEVNIVQPGNKQVYAFAEESDLYAAIDIVRDEAERVIVSRKNKYKTLFRKGATQVKEILKRINPNSWRRKK
jgi:putative sigma-54 modulation protein